MNAIVEKQREKMVPVADLKVAPSAHGTVILPTNMNELMRYADVMASGGLALPKYLRGNTGAALFILNQAMRWEMDPYAVANKSYSVNDRIAFEAQLIAAVVNTRSGIQGRLRYDYEGEGDNLTCTVTGKLEGEDYAYTSPPIGSITTKNSPLWRTDPQQQLGYFSARSWARRYTPEVMLGVYDRDEASQIGPDNARDVTPKSAMAARLEARQAQDDDEGFNQDFVHDQVSNEPEVEPADDLLTDMDGEPGPENTVTDAPEAAPESVRPSLSEKDRTALLDASRAIYSAFENNEIQRIMREFKDAHQGQDIRDAAKPVFQHLLTVKTAEHGLDKAEAFDKALEALGLTEAEFKEGMAA